MISSPYRIASISHHVNGTSHPQASQIELCRWYVHHVRGEDAATWGGVTRRLTDDFRVVRIHRRVYAPGADIALPHSMAVEAADIVAVAGLNKPPVLLVEHSSGAVAAMEAALLAPSAFAGLLLHEPPMPARELVAAVAGVRTRVALDAGDPVEAVRIHRRDIVRMPAGAADAVSADHRVRAALSTHAEALIARPGRPVRSQH
ncbi:alpha/beta fold hydrolase [Streptomyces sp. NPDC056638]|uniref:alpha/beta fold hydrolase n=1 Tax=Streptomyces sp. NPDC056638 TaxID=3345887 RepID=UPI003675D7AA